MEARVDVAVLLQLLLRHPVQEVAVDAARQQVVGVLAKLGVDAAQPVSQVAAVAGGIVCEGLQLCELPEKPGGETNENVEWGGEGRLLDQTGSRDIWYHIFCLHGRESSYMPW